MTASRRTLLLAVAGAAIAVLAVAHLRREAPAAPSAEPRPAAAAAAQPAAKWFDPSMSASSRAPAMFAPRPPTIYGRNGRPIDFGGKDAAQYIAERSAAARIGDMRAAYQVYQAESACAAAQDPLPEFENPSERAAFERERARVQKLCHDVSPAQMQERMRFLTQAAQAGNRDADIDFFMEGPNGKTVDFGAETDDPEIQQWKQQALGYLKQAGAQCDFFALALLSTAYDAGQIVPRDLKMTMAYAIASGAARHVAPTEQQLRDRFGDELSAADFSAAMQAGQDLARSSCDGQAAPRS